MQNSNRQKVHFTVFHNTINIQPPLKFVNKHHLGGSEFHYLPYEQSILLYNKSPYISFLTNCSEVKKKIQIFPINQNHGILPTCPERTDKDINKNLDHQYESKSEQLIIDLQYEQPLSKKTHSKNIVNQKHGSLISQEQITKGFNNSFNIALNKVNQKQKSNQQKLQSFQVNYQHSYNNLRESNQNSSVDKKKKRKIFENSPSSLNKDRTKSMYEHSVVSFGTSSAEKMISNLRNSALEDYELKTSRKYIQQGDKSKQNDKYSLKLCWVNNFCHDQPQKQQYEEIIVPNHILKAWKKHVK